MSIAVAILLGLLAAAPASAAVLVAASCSNADVQTKVNEASSGDTVQLPAPCTPTWSANVSIPSTKGITLDGDGATVAGKGVTIAPHATVSTRVTNFTFSATGVEDLIRVTGTSLTTARWRLDHATFTGDAHRMIRVDASPGLIDHVTFTALGWASEFIHVEGWGSSSSAGWTNAHTPGSDEAVYIEDSTFTTTSSESGNAWIQSYYGARIVYRYNTFNYTKTDAHGTAGNIGTRWWEFYGNTFDLAGGANPGGSAMNLRAGSGIIFGNIRVGNPGQVGLCEEDSGYPALYQIGRGQDQSLYPAYAWNNGTFSYGINSCEATPAANMVALNRDVYVDTGASCTAGGACTTGVGSGTTLPTTCTTNTGFWKTDEGEWWAANAGNDGRLYKCTSTNTWTLYYTPLIYPHPLQGVAGGSPQLPLATTRPVVSSRPLATSRP
jgi:hypothetical protein